MTRDRRSPPPYSGYGSSYNSETVSVASIPDRQPSSIAITATQRERSPLLRRARHSFKWVQGPGTPRLILVCLCIITPILIFTIHKCVSARPIHWIDVNPAANCSRIGTREYTGTLSHMPEGDHPFTSCTSIPISINDRLVKPLSCWSEALQREEQVVDNDGKTITRNITRTITKARWMINFGEVDCVPTWDETPSGQLNPILDDLCHDYGIRVSHSYMTGSRVPPGLDPIDTCQKTPVVVRGIPLYPDQCIERSANGHGESIMHARFLLNETQTYGVLSSSQYFCIPSWETDPIPDKVCREYGTRIYNISMPVSRIAPGLDPITACQKTPTSRLPGKQLYPHQCSTEVDSHGDPIICAQFLVTDEPSCQAVWSEPKRDETCTRYGTKRFTSFLEKIPLGLDGMELCWKKSQTFSGEEKKPDLCQKVALPDRTEKIVASWLISRDVPECYTNLKDVQSKGCVHAAMRRVEGRVADIGEREDRHRMCITTPLGWSDGRKYLPVSCEKRTSWFGEYMFALYDVLDSACVRA